MCDKNADGLFRKTVKKVPSKLNLSSLTKIREIIEKSKDGTFECLFVVDQIQDVVESQFVSRVVHPQSGRVLKIHSNQPTLHFSTCSEFPAPMTKNDSMKHEEEVETDGESIENFTLEYLRTKLTEKEIDFFKCRTDSDSMRLNNNKFVSGAYKLPNGVCRLVDSDSILNEPIKGKGGSNYCKNSGFSIACHNFPNAVNHQRKHPEVLLKPGEVYENLLTLKIGIHVAKKPKQEDSC